MSKSKMNLAFLIALLLAGTVQSYGQTGPAPAKEQVDKLIAVLESDAPHKEKADACRQLAVVGTKDAVTPLAVLLGDEKLSHMARYALEPIPDPAVDAALRDALGKLTGRPLIGVTGSIGMRRDTNAVGPLTKMLQHTDREVVQAAARALGNIGNLPAAKALQRALVNSPADNQLALCEGLFRCAESLAAKGRRDEAVTIYDQLRKLQVPRQVRAGALRGAILTRGKGGPALLRQHLQSDDYVLFSAAVQSAAELPGTEVTQVLTAELNQMPADNQILIIQTLGKRADAAALSALFALAGSGAKPVRLAAIRTLPEIGHASAIPVLVGLLADADSEVSQAAQEAFAAIPGSEADAAVMAMLNSSQTSLRLDALELIGRRRMKASIPALLRATGDDDPKVRPTALTKLGELASVAELPALLDLLARMKGSQDLDAAEQALSAVCAKSDNPESCTEQLTDMLARTAPAQKRVLLRVLSTVGGTSALRAVRGSVNDPDKQVRATAIGALCEWRTADAAPDLLALAKTLSKSSRKTLALRGYIRLIRDENLSTKRRLAMCKEADALVRRGEEKKLLLGVLGTVPTKEALSMALAHMDNPATKDEASFAAVAICEKIIKEEPEEVLDAVQKVMRATDNKEVTGRAKAMLDMARKTAGG